MKSIERFFSHKHFYVYFGIWAWLVTLAIYFPARNAMLIDDGLSGLWDFQQYGWQGYWHSYGMKSFYHSYFAFLGILYALFGTNPLGWFLVFTALHAINTALVFRATLVLFEWIRNTHAVWIALFTSLLFLLSPYQSENIIWAATGHYAITFMILWWGIIQVVNMASQIHPARKYILFHVAFAVSLTTLEISFFFPLIWFLLFVVCMIYQWNGRLAWLSLPTIWLPQIAIVTLYLWLYHANNGNWIPNRYTTPHSVNLPQLSITWYQQLTKLITCAHYWDYPIREKIYLFCTRWKVCTAIFGILSLGISIVIIRKQIKQIALLLCLGIATIAVSYPFLEKYFMYLFRFENDRYLYYTSAFVFVILVWLLFSIHQMVRGMVLVAWLCVFVYGIFPAVKARQIGAAIHQRFINKFPSVGEGKIYLLNIPAYGADTYVFRSKDRLPIALQAIHGIRAKKQIEQVAFYNAQNISDSFLVKQIGPQQLQVINSTPGSWWMYENIGAVSYETNNYKFEKDPWNGYMLTFTQPLQTSDRIYIFQRGKFQRVGID